MRADQRFFLKSYQGLNNRQTLSINLGAFPQSDTQFFWGWLPVGSDDTR